MGEKVPVVVVLTKYDKFIDRVERTLDENEVEGLTDDAVEELLKQRADAELRDIYTRPLETFAGPDVPCATVSSAYL